MATRVCPDCAINFPPTEGFRTCNACGGITSYVASLFPESNWQGRAAAVAARLDQIARETLWEVTHIDASLKLDDEGMLWLSSHDAIRSGTANHLTMSETDVVSIGPPDDSASGPDNNLYEVIAYVDAKRAYWVKPLRVPDHV